MGIKILHDTETDGNITCEDADFSGNVQVGSGFYENSFSVGGVYGAKYWTGAYNISNTSIAELVNLDGTSLEDGGAYRFTAHLDTTSVDNSSRAVFWNENGTWNVNITGQSGTSSTHVLFLVNGGVPSMKTYHASDYAVKVWHERLNLNEKTGTDNTEHYFGADAYMSKIVDTVSVNASILKVDGSLIGTPADASTNSLKLGRTDNSNYWYVNHAGDDFRLYNPAGSGSHVLFGVDASGTVKANNVGIGTATPSEKLDVVGNIAVSGTVDGIDIATDVAANSLKPTKEYIASRGENLMSNYSGLLGDNQNFSAFVFDGSVANSSPGSFKYVAAGSSTKFTDEYMAVNAGKRYKMSVDAKTLNGVGRYYMMTTCYDVDNNLVNANNHMYKANTLTTLAVALADGDTTITLASNGSNWDNSGTAGASTHERSVMIWEYENSFGYKYPPETYSRLWTGNAWDPGNISGNVITLRVPWAGGAYPIGTNLSNGDSGGTYKYNVMGNVTLTTDWVTYTGYMDGVDLSGTNVSTKFPPGTAKIRMGWLLNYQGSTSETSWFTNLFVGLDYLGGTDNAVTATTAAQATLAADATTLATPRAINGVDFDGSAAITVTAAGSTLSDTVTVAKGGTGRTSLAADKVLTGNGTSGIVAESNLTYDGTNLTATSGGTNAPNVIIESTSNHATGGNLIFRKLRADDTPADGNLVGGIVFQGEDDANNSQTYGSIVGVSQETGSGTEGGKISISVASHDGETKAGLVIVDGSDEDEVDVTIGSGTGSVTTVAGDLAVARQVTVEDLHVSVAGPARLDLIDTGGQTYRFFARNSDDVFGIYDGTNTQTFFRYTGHATLASTKLALLEAGGKVGIGTTTPTKTLDVSGDINLTGNILPGITGIKILPRDFIADDGGRPVAIDDVTTGKRHIESHSNYPMYASVEIPMGFKATTVLIYGNGTSAVTVNKADINSSTITSVGSGSIGSPITITHTLATTTNYLLIELAQTSGEKVYGGLVSILKN